MILVTGATGNVGGELVSQLLARGRRVRAMTRRPEAARLPAEVEVVRGDFDDPASIDAALGGVEGVFFMSAQVRGSAPSPTHDLIAVDAARRAGVRHVVKLSVLGRGGDDASDPIVRWHAEAEEALQASGVPWTLLRPGRFMSNALAWAPMIRKGPEVHVAFAARPAASIDPRDIASLACVALTEGGHVGKTYELSGPEVMTPAEEVRILSAVLERPLTLVPVSDDAARAGMLRSGMPPVVVDSIMKRVEKTDHGAEVLSTVHDVLGRPARTFREWAITHAAAFR